VRIAVDPMQKVRIHPIPPEILEAISNELFWYSIGLVKLERQLNGEEAEILGSGTLVAIKGAFGILTAQHVTECVRNVPEIGLIISDEVHQYSIETKYLHIIDVAKPTEPSVGPDLSIIILPNNLLGTLKARKSFFNISQKREEVLVNPLQLDLGVWVLFGFLQEKTVTEGPKGGYAIVKGFHGQFGFTGITKYYEQGEYDFWEVGVDYKFNEALPITFGGTSGGGLWQVHVTGSKEDGFQVQRRILMGVAFYETEIRNNIRYIRCNGPRTIYEITPKIVKQNVYAAN
jgi:hypothetical protein